MGDDEYEAASTSSGSDSPQDPQHGGASSRSPRESLDLDLPLSAGAKGTGPRLFCGHVPKDVNDEMVRQHFSKWGTVNDVYFPRHKKTLKRRPFCFVTFANKEDAQRALAESGLEIAGVPIKNLTMVEDRDKYYTNKHATARQALLQALKQLGPSTTQPAASGSSSSSSAPAPPAPPANGLGSGGLGPMSAEQLSNLASVLALEGVPTDVILQTLGLPATLAEVMLPSASAPLPALACLDGAGAALLAQSLSGPALSSQTGLDLATAAALARGSFDLRTSFDLSSASIPMVPSARTSMDLSSLHQSLAAAAAMHTSDSRSTLATCDWSNAPSARTSLDISGLPLMPAASAGFMASAGGLSRLSLDAALALQQAQQLQQSQQQLLASQGRLSAVYPTPQQPMASVMHSGFYQAAAPAPPPAPVLPLEPQPQLSMQSVLSSGFYGGGPPAAPPSGPPPPPPARHSIALGDYSSPPGLTPFSDTWSPAPREQAATLGGYSTALRPSIDRAGLPPLPPRSPNQDALPRLPGSGSPDAMLSLAGRWSMSGQRVMA